MSAVVPPRFLFRWSFAPRYVKGLPGRAGELFALGNEHQIPSLAPFDGVPQFAKLSLAWNEAGFAVVLRVLGKKTPIHVDAMDPLVSDGLQLWIDTRCTQNVHRATRFCHHLVFNPPGGKLKGNPGFRRLPIAQARESTGAVDSDPVVSFQPEPDGYQMGIWFPAESLHGYDPSSHPKLGFYSLVTDAQLGSQSLTVDDQFPFRFDPSLWQTLELQR